MNARQAVDLLELLAQYATEYGAECDGDITVKQLADDLAQSCEGEYAPAARPGNLRDHVYDGLNQ